MTPSRMQQVEAIFNAAMQRDADARAAYVKEVCAEDEELVREVESLLAEALHSTGPLRSNVWRNTDLLKAGTQLGPYKIEGPLGSGGMGQVFRAVDTRLGRVVAIKTIQERFNDRFEREARAISALNHPHICTLYDVGSNGSGTPYLVMEMVEGETLASRIERGKLSIAETLKYGQQIAGALAAAHAGGVIHRDLKPGNVMLTKAGVKVLDFGLAKLSVDETLTISQGIMGTPAYMAPEQFEGKAADARADIYALGLILYEMATGKRATRGEMPPLDPLPPQFAHVVERCLKPDPDDRWQAARGIAAELKWIAEQPTARQAPRRSSVLRWALPTGLALALVFAGIVVLYLRTPPDAHPVEFGLPLDRTAYADIPRVSPDGSAIVYTAVDPSGRRQLWLRPLDSDNAKPVTGTDDALYPFWSPDGRWIVMRSGN
jgi:eukaryotic-like serine/threonine-protein kinase